MTSWITSMLASLFAGLGWTVVGIALAAALALWVFGKALPAWIGPLFIALLAAAFVGNNVLKTEQLRAEQSAHQTTKTENAEKWAKQARLDADAAEAVNKALLEGKARQGELHGELAKAHTETVTAQTAATAAAARERATRGQLRNEILRRAEAERESRRHQSELAAAVASGPPTEAAVQVCADMLGRVDERAGELAAFADASRVAGQACEREHDAAVKLNTKATQ